MELEVFHKVLKTPEIAREIDLSGLPAIFKTNLIAKHIWMLDEGIFGLDEFDEGEKISLLIRVPETVRAFEREGIKLPRHKLKLVTRQMKDQPNLKKRILELVE